MRGGQDRSEGWDSESTIDDHPPPAGVASSLRWLYGFVAAHRSSLWLLLGLSLLAIALVVAQPYLTKRLIDDGLLAGSFPSLLWFAGLILLFGILSLLLSGLNRYLHTLLSGRILFALREDVYAHLQCLSPTFYMRQRTGDILSRLDTDIAELQRFSVDGLFTAFSGAIGLLGAVSMMIFLDWRLSLLLFGLLPAQWLHIAKMRPGVEDKNRQVRESGADISSFMAETLPNMKFIQDAVAEQRELSRLADLNHRFHRNLLRLQWIEFAATGVPAFLLNCARAAVFILGGYQVIQQQMALGSLIAFASYMAMASGPVRSLQGLYISWQRVKVSLERVRYLREQPLEVPAGGIHVPKNLRGEIQIQDLSFHYPGTTQEVLRHINLHVPAGCKVGLCGPVGSGKTTLVDLLLRHHNPCAGQILVDGHDITTFAYRSWRRRLAVVSQDLVLFRGSIAANIQYRVPGAPRLEIEHAAERAGLGAFLASLPNGIDTAIGERGTRLSGGQRQRVAIARALLQKPLILILDEATSAIDIAAETELLARIDALFATITRLLISHRATPLADVDLLLRMHGGELRTVGASEKEFVTGR